MRDGGMVSSEHSRRGTGMVDGIDRGAVEDKDVRRTIVKKTEGYILINV